ncbi:hypothetical protein [Cupriavidus sp. IDO]|uniref:hypothetical protein n=1 Tax=Cupriavidus sp. IDO TaxID=1539142 RepID=UPI0005798F64|nr:hypothetical protein [Cupriavidus sp. IDO]KWR74532.1 hypothetical protein RM96_35960 [Cupriavidus sp. IDO]
MISASQDTWPYSAFFPRMPQFEALEWDFADTLRRMTELNLAFTRSMFDEAQLDSMAFLVIQNPEELFAHEFACELPLLGGPLHYVSAMFDLAASAQRKWIDGWGRLLGFGLMPQWPGRQDNVTDIPPWSVRETPRPQPAS